MVVVSGVISAALECGENELCDTSSVELAEPVRIELTHEQQVTPII